MCREFGQIALEQGGRAQLQFDQATQVRHAVEVDGAAQQPGKMALDMRHLGRHGDVVAGAGQRYRELAQGARGQYHSRCQRYQRALEREVEHMGAVGAGGRGELCRCIKGHSDVVASFVGHGFWRVVWRSCYTQGLGPGLLLSKSVTNVGVASSPGFQASRYGSLYLHMTQHRGGPSLGSCIHSRHTVML